VLPFSSPLNLLHCSKGEVVYSFADEPIMQSEHGWGVMAEKEPMLT
jgi:hypothetical protein